MRIGMRIDANAHQSVNARIRIECTLQVLCEQAFSRPRVCGQCRDKYDGSDAVIGVPFVINSKRMEISLPTEKLKVHQWWWTTVPLHYCHLERAKALTLTTSPGLSRTSTGDSEGPGRVDLVINRGSSTQWHQFL